MATLYDIAEGYKMALDAIEVNEDGEIVNVEFLEAVEGDFEEKMEATALAYKNLLSDIKAYKEEKAKFDAKIKTAEKQAEWLAGYIDMNMRRVDRDKLKTARVALHYRSSVKTIIDDLEAVPEVFKTVKTETAVDKTAIKKAISSGEPIPGAHLEESKNLQIK